jgi:ferredoxin
MEFTADGDAAEKAVVVVRPCDANSLVFLDKVFGQQPYNDPYYLSRRENTAIVALACVKAPYASCFCTSVGGEPVGDRGADVLATDLGDKYLVEFITPRGEALLPLLEGASDAGGAELGKKEEIKEAAKATIQSIVPQKEATAKLKPNFESPYWAELHRRCLACGTCTYLCPSCHCFDITDETKGDEGVRIRSWDSCMFPLFTRETSGHNPRPGQRERWRQRVMHKFSYIPENFNEVGCVGCGRCVINCPVNLDIRKIVEDISKL